MRTGKKQHRKRCEEHGKALAERPTAQTPKISSTSTMHCNHRNHQNPRSSRPTSGENGRPLPRSHRSSLGITNSQPVCVSGIFIQPTPPSNGLCFYIVVIQELGCWNQPLTQSPMHLQIPRIFPSFSVKEDGFQDIC